MNATIAALILSALVQAAASPVHQAVKHEASSPIVRLSGPQTTCAASKGFRPLLQGTGCVRSFQALILAQKGIQVSVGGQTMMTSNQAFAQGLPLDENLRQPHSPVLLGAQGHAARQGD